MSGTCWHLSCGGEWRDSEACAPRRVSAVAPRPEARVRKSYDTGGRNYMNIFYIIGVVVVVLFVLGYFGLR